MTMYFVVDKKTDQAIDVVETENPNREIWKYAERQGLAVQEILLEEIEEGEVNSVKTGTWGTDAKT